MDYSNKYGFGYQLSDHTVGVLFNNGTHMSLLPDRKYAIFSLSQYSNSVLIRHSVQYRCRVVSLYSTDHTRNLRTFASCLVCSLSPPTRTIHYYAELGQRSVFPTCEVPEHFVGQVTVLKYFSHYMEENLMDVSCTLLPLFTP